MTKPSPKPRRQASLSRPLPQARYIDPEVEIIAALLQRSGLTNEAIAERVSKARAARMAPSTVRRFRELATSRPANDTINWMLWAIGKRRTITDL